jgi:hypothetical protein
MLVPLVEELDALGLETTIYCFSERKDMMVGGHISSGNHHRHKVGIDNRLSARWDRNCAGGWAEFRISTSWKPRLKSRASNIQ